MRAIDAEDLKRSIAVSALIDDQKTLEQIIDEQPTIERKKGKWIYTRPYSAINCSSCHHCSWSMSYEDLVKSFNYCPNCGADMRGETWEH